MNNLSQGISASDATAKVDRIQAALSQMPQLDLPPVHRFTPHLYTRELAMPKGAMVISKIHKTEHQFFVLSGSALVWDAQNGVQKISAPHVGITKPGTRRILFITEDCVWITAHPTELTTVEEIEAEIIQPHPINTDTANQPTLEDIMKQFQIADEQGRLN